MNLMGVVDDGICNCLPPTHSPAVGSKPNSNGGIKVGGWGGGGEVGECGVMVPSPHRLDHTQQTSLRALTIKQLAEVGCFFIGGIHSSTSIHVYPLAQPAGLCQPQRRPCSV